MNANKRIFVQIVLPVIISVLGSFVLVSLFHGRAIDIVGANHIDSYSSYYGHNMKHRHNKDLSVSIYDIGDIPDTVNPRLWISKHINDLLNYKPRAVVLDFMFEHKEHASSDDSLVLSIKRLGKALNGQVYTACMYHPLTRQVRHSFFTIEEGIKYGHVNLDSYQGINLYELVDNNGVADDTVQWLPLKFINHHFDREELKKKLVDYTDRNWEHRTVKIDTTSKVKHYLFDNKIVIIGNVFDPRDLQEPHYRKHILGAAKEDNSFFMGEPGAWLLAYGINAAANDTFFTYDSVFWPFLFSLIFALLFCLILFGLDSLRERLKYYSFFQKLGVSNVTISVITAVIVLVLLFLFECYLIPLASSLVIKYFLIAFSIEYSLVSVAIMSAIYSSFKL